MARRGVGVLEEVNCIVRVLHMKRGGIERGGDAGEEEEGGEIIQNRTRTGRDS